MEQNFRLEGVWFKQTVLNKLEKNYAVYMTDHLYFYKSYIIINYDFF